MPRKFLSVFLFMAVCALPAAAADTALEVPLPNPLQSAKAGQWVQYRITTLFGSAEQKQTILSIDGDENDDERVLTIKSEMIIDGEVVDERTDAITYKQALQEQANALEESQDVKTRLATVDFNGQKLEAVEVDFVQQGKHCLLYLSEKVPVVGMISMTVDNEDGPAMQLIDYGD